MEITSDSPSDSPSQRRDPGEPVRRAGIRHVAALAGVAPSSVSRVLSNPSSASDAMRERVLRAARELRYEPDFLAQSLRRGQTLSVGFILADIANPVMATIVRGVGEVLREHGYTLLLVNSESRPELDESSIRFLESRRVDGLLVAIASETHQPTLDAIAAFRSPIVFVDRSLPPGFQSAFVGHDHAMGMTAAIEHLISLGHLRIAQIGGSHTTLPARERQRAMDRVISRHPDVEGLAFPGSLSTSHGFEATMQVLELEPRPTAIVAAGNQLLVGCLTALRQRGMTVGRDIAVIGCDDTGVSALFEPPIATLSRDTMALGRAAAERLLELIVAADEPGEQRLEPILLPTSFTPRESCLVPVETLGR